MTDIVDDSFGDDESGVSSISVFLIVFFTLAILIGIPSLIVYCQRKDDNNKCKICMASFLVKCLKRKKMQVEPKFGTGDTPHDLNGETEDAKGKSKAKIGAKRSIAVKKVQGENESSSESDSSEDDESDSGSEESSSSGYGSESSDVADVKVP